MIFDNFSDPQSSNTIYIQKGLPIFQNKVYDASGEASNVTMGVVELIQSQTSGFIFNKKFQPELMIYDQQYQNEQGTSKFFLKHLDHVYQILDSHGLQNKKIIEIGCGKALFFDILLKKGLNAVGFDPTYEGENPRIIKEFYSNKSNEVGDVIIMRHTLEHIPDPFSFLHTIAEANGFKGTIYIEVPTFDWIIGKSAYWDIFYEHCNYFTESSLSKMFHEAKTDSFFGGQYIYLIGDLSQLKDTIDHSDTFVTDASGFSMQRDAHASLVKTSKSKAIWGAGAKGSTFLNIMDPERIFFEYVIDINPAKQSKFIGGTGHPIFSSDALRTRPVNEIFVMNENYLSEIQSIVGDLHVSIYTI
ncbi:MAG TPA: class I SAM-dependent methyltransferase [Flavitalea sp.]|nr:class I SAM-dependent methyltransferase [Flavitalea sp.]